MQPAVLHARRRGRPGAAASALWVTMSRVLPAWRVRRSSRSSTWCAGLVVEVAGGLVGQDEQRGRGRGRGRWPRAAARRRRAGRESVSARSARPTSLEQRQRRRRPAAPGAAVQLQRQEHVLQHREGGDEVEELEDEADVLAAKERALLLGEGGQVDAVDLAPRPRVGRSMPLIRLSRVDLPEPLRPSMTTNSPRPMRLVDVAQHHPLAVALPVGLTQPPQLHQGHVPPPAVLTAHACLLTPLMYA